MSNRLFQGIIHQMHDSIGRTVGIVDDSSVVIACSDLARVGERNDFLVSEMAADGECHTRDGFTYKAFGVGDRPEYAVFVAGNGRTCGTVLFPYGRFSCGNKAVL